MNSHVILQINHFGAIRLARRRASLAAVGSPHHYASRSFLLRSGVVSVV
uniref:Uncharacterized protein n=1 Tax=Rhizophora mucronata TaxID=61149 RepID=A0A2P2MEV8_RHIMU